MFVISAGERSGVFISVTFEVPAQSGHQFAVRGEHSIKSGADDIARKRLTCGLNRDGTAPGVTQHSGRFVVDSSRQRGIDHWRSFLCCTVAELPGFVPDFYAAGQLGVKV